MKNKMLGIFVCMLLIGTSGIAVADWDENDGHKMHFPQLPDPNGWDVNFHDWLLGDDWKCSESGPVTDIHFWISWRGDDVQDLPWIKIGIFSNNPGPPSTPEENLWSRVFDVDEFIIRGPFDGDQGWYHPPNIWFEHDHFNYYQINIVEIEEPFEQEEGIIYWLVISVPFYEPDALGWKTSLEHYEDAAVYGHPGGWYLLTDPLSGNQIDLAFVITGGEPIPDLICEGKLVWTGLKPWEIVNGTFQVGNGGDPGSLLNWAVDTTSLPTWGVNWTFSPSSGTGLLQGSWTTITVGVKAPREENKNYNGTIKVVNTDDSSDYCKIDVSLSTPKNKVFNFNLRLLSWLFEQFPNTFPILRYLVGV